MMQAEVRNVRLNPAERRGAGSQPDLRAPVCKSYNHFRVWHDFVI